MRTNEAGRAGRCQPACFHLANSSQLSLVAPARRYEAVRALQDAGKNGGAAASANLCVDYVAACCDYQQFLTLVLEFKGMAAWGGGTQEDMLPGGEERGTEPSAASEGKHSSAESKS